MSFKFKYGFDNVSAKTFEAFGKNENGEYLQNHIIDFDKKLIPANQSIIVQDVLKYYDKSKFDEIAASKTNGPLYLMIDALLNLNIQNHYNDHGAIPFVQAVNSKTKDLNSLDIDFNDIFAKMQSGTIRNDDLNVVKNVICAVLDKKAYNIFESDQVRYEKTAIIKKEILNSNTAIISVKRKCAFYIDLSIDVNISNDGLNKNILINLISTSGQFSTEITSSSVSFPLTISGTSTSIESDFVRKLSEACKVYSDILRSHKNDSPELNFITKNKGSAISNSEETLTKSDTIIDEYVPITSNLPLNIILYGPPGTGKTYNSKIYAVAMVESKSLEEIKKLSYDEICARYNIYLKHDLICFVTFHQNYGYEEFIEGIAPDLMASDIKYILKDGIFKSFCKKIPVSFTDRYTNSIGVEKTITFNSTNVDQEEINENTIIIGNNFKKVFIIDEINRGNISKIFGELITLIEESKREGNLEASSAILPYSNETFAVPNNLCILGTMNTADRSIALLDTALRRRFTFIEMMPRYNLLNADLDSSGIDLQQLLQKINERITVLYDRDHTIGHSFLLHLRNINDLANAFKFKIIPLLQEYFYEDYDKIKLILGDSELKNPDFELIKCSKKNLDKLFPGSKYDELNGTNDKIYYLDDAAFYYPESYKGIYE